MHKEAEQKSAVAKKSKRGYNLAEKGKANGQALYEKLKGEGTWESLDRSLKDLWAFQEYQENRVHRFAQSFTRHFVEVTAALEDYSGTPHEESRLSVRRLGESRQIVKRTGDLDRLIVALFKFSLGIIAASEDYRYVSHRFSRLAKRRFRGGGLARD